MSSYILFKMVTFKDENKEQVSSEKKRCGWIRAGWVVNRLVVNEICVGAVECLAPITWSPDHRSLSLNKLTTDPIRECFSGRSLQLSLSLFDQFCLCAPPILESQSNVTTLSVQSDLWHVDRSQHSEQYAIDTRVHQADYWPGASCRGFCSSSASSSMMLHTLGGRHADTHTEDEQLVPLRVSFDPSASTDHHSCRPYRKQWLSER